MFGHAGGAADSATWIIDQADSIDWQARIDELAPLDAPSWTFGDRAARLVGASFDQIIDACRIKTSNLSDEAKLAASTYGLSRNELMSLALCAHLCVALPAASLLPCRNCF